MGAHERTCVDCGRTGTRGFTSLGHGFTLRGRTRTAQRLNMRSGPCTWRCATGHGCQDLHGLAVLVLGVVADHGPVTGTDVAYHLRGSPQVYGPIFRALEQRGYATPQYTGHGGTGRAWVATRAGHERLARPTEEEVPA